MSAQLDAILADLPDGDCHPDSRQWRRELVIAIKRDQHRRRVLGEPRRVHGRTAA